MSRSSSTAYRAPLRAPSDQEIAALGDLTEAMRRFKLWGITPIFLAVLAGPIVGCLLHVSGYWSVSGRLADGSYFVNKSTVVVAVLVAFALSVVPGYVTFRLAMSLMLASWRRQASARYGLDDATLKELTELYAPRWSGLGRVGRDMVGG